MRVCVCIKQAIHNREGKKKIADEIRAICVARLLQITLPNPIKDHNKCNYERIIDVGIHCHHEIVFAAQDALDRVLHLHLQCCFN